jgi:hypothetical protein
MNKFQRKCPKTGFTETLNSEMKFIKGWKLINDNPPRKKCKRTGFYL